MTFAAYIPVYNALTLARYAICDALDGVAPNGWHWQQPVEGTELPFGVAQSQDRGGGNLAEIGPAGWSGLIVLRAHAYDLKTAEDIMADVPAVLASLPAPDGYTIDAAFDKLLDIPVQDGVWTAAQQWRVTIQRERE